MSAPKIAIISGSHRPESQSEKVANYLAAQLKEKHNAEPWVYALGKEPLPLWDEGMWGVENPDFAFWDQYWQPLSAKLQGSDGVVIIAPEWNGTAPAGLKNFFHLTSGQDLGHKPGLLVSVTASAHNGAYPIAELRMSGTKNNKLVYVPDHLIIRNAGDILNAEPTTGEHAGTDSYMRERIDYTLGVFRQYVDALKPLREQGDWINEKYAYGM